MQEKKCSSGGLANDVVNFLVGSGMTFNGDPLSRTDDFSKISAREIIFRTDRYYDDFDGLKCSLEGSFPGIDVEKDPVVPMFVMIRMP